MPIDGAGDDLHFPEELRERFEPLRLLGEGGIGGVLLARDCELDREVAIKLLRSQGLVDKKGEVALRRFQQEARGLAALRHPNVLQVFAYGVAGGQPYLVTEYLEGRPLEEFQGDAMVPREQAVEIMRQASRGIQALHDEGYLHRDIKPANILWTREQRAVLIDFGLILDQGGGAGLTATGNVVGTLYYMAPEILCCEPPSPATDWYSWGATLYFLLEGQPPFRPEDITDRAQGRRFRKPRLWRTGEETPLGRGVLTCLEQDPARRPQDRRQLRRALEDGGSKLRTDLMRKRSTHPASRGRLVRWIRSRGGRLTLGIGAGLLVLFVFSLALGYWLADRGGSPGEGIARVPRGTTQENPRKPEEPVVTVPGLGADYPGRVKAELEVATLLRLLPDGRTVPIERWAPEQGGRLLLSEDPWDWAETLDHLPEARRFLEWIRSDGRPEELPPELVRELQECSGWFANQFQPSPFAAFLPEGLPPPGEDSSQPRFRRRPGKSELPPPPPRLGPWARRTLVLLERARKGFQEKEETFVQASVEGRHPEIPTFMFRQHRILGFGYKLRIILRYLGKTPGQAGPVWRWIRGPGEAMEGMLYAGFRSLHEEEKTRRWVARLLCEAIWEHRHLMLYPGLSLGFGHVFPRTGNRAAEMVLVRLRSLCDDNRDNSNQDPLPWELTEQTGLSFLAADWREEIEPHWRGQVLESLVDGYLRRGRTEDAQKLLLEQKQAYRSARFDTRVALLNRAYRIWRLAQLPTFGGPEELYVELLSVTRRRTSEASRDLARDLRELIGERASPVAPGSGGGGTGISGP